MIVGKLTSDKVRKELGFGMNLLRGAFGGWVVTSIISSGGFVPVYKALAEVCESYHIPVRKNRNA